MNHVRAPAIAQEFGFSSRHWIRLAAAGKIPCAVQPGGPGGHWLFNRDSFYAWARYHGYAKIDKRRTTPTDQVYLCYSGGLVKIGVSSNSRIRSRSFKTASPLPVTILVEIPGGYKLEAELHQRFAESRRHGEWFALNDDLREFLTGNNAAARLERAEGDFKTWLASHK